MPSHADLLILNAVVETMDPARPRAEAVALGGGRLLAVGSRAEAEALRGPATRVVDAGGATVMPGFVESHLHIGLGGVELGNLQLAKRSGDALAEAVRGFAAARPEGFLMAQGLDYTAFGHPTGRADLDALVPDRPFAAMAPDHHTVWANTAALKAAGLLTGAATPPGHEVVLGADGLATGELREFEAFAPIMRLAGQERLNLGIATGEEPDPAPGPDAMATDRAAIRAGLDWCARHGVTSMVTMDGNRYTCALLAGIEAEGALTARVKVPFHMKPHMTLDALDRASAMARDYRGRVSSGFVKMFMDGVIDSGTAFLLDGSGSEGLFDAARFDAICVEASRRGLQIAVHAIGDGAVRRTLDGYAAARAALGDHGLRHRIEHIELIDPADIPRLGALGVVASLQPPHPPGAMDFPLQPTLDLIGRARWRDAYLWRSLAEAGAEVVYASDWPVTDLSVLRGLQAALTRRPFEGARDERLDFDATLAAYTRTGAQVAGWTDTGILRTGMAADVVVLGANLRAIDPETIGAVPVRMTIADGRVVWEG